MEILRTYLNGNCNVTLYEDGTKVREYEDEPLPIYPESLDLKITNWCDAGCGWCHEKSTKRGWHGTLSRMVRLLTQLPAGVEIAIGGGHPMSHPGFDDFVKELSDHGLICNVTINQFHFEKELPRIERLVADGHIKGVGYSYKDKPCLWNYEHLVNHVIVGVIKPHQLEEVVQVNKKVLLLGYKQVGRGINHIDHYGDLVESLINHWYRFLFEAVRIADISFDNLAIEQLNPKRLFTNPADYDKFYMGTDGSFSMYIDAIKKEYAVSSTSVDRMKLTQNMAEIFKNVRERSISLDI